MSIHLTFHIDLRSGSFNSNSVSLRDLGSPMQPSRGNQNDIDNVLTHHDTSICSLMLSGNCRLMSRYHAGHQPHPFEKLLRERIAILDGAMGTMIQRHKLSEADYRGERFRDWKGKDLKGSLELLQLTKPEVIEEIHTQYLEAGADLIETNTFSATTIGLHDFLFPGEPKSGRKDPEFFQRVVDDTELRAARARDESRGGAASRGKRRIAWSNATGATRFVAGSMGPLPVTASLSPDVNDPGFRAVTFDQIRQAYARSGRGVDRRRRRSARWSKRFSTR